MDSHPDYSKYISDYLETESKIFGMIDYAQINKAIQVLLDAYEHDSAIYIMGNGGSAATASHIVCDFNKGACYKLKKKFNFISLCDNLAIMTALSNDVCYDEIFKYQLEGHVKEKDLIIAISGSGNSKNVINAVQYGKNEGALTISLTGYSGGKLKEISDYPIHIPIADMQKAEDMHMIVLHMMAQIIAKTLGNPLC